MAALMRLLIRSCKEISGRPVTIQRNTNLNDVNGLHNSTSHRCLSTSCAQQNKEAWQEKYKEKRRETKHKNEREFQIQDILRRIDHNRPITSYYFRRLFSTIQREGEMDKQEASLLLHVCCSGLHDFSPSLRAERTDAVWALLKDLGVEPDIKLYNLRLKALRDNQRHIDPMQELMDIKAMGCTPDAVTFTLFIGCFCNDGDTQGADLILETMQEAGFGLSINIFNSYIAGHLKNDSIQKALDTLDIIKSRDLNANQDTYFRFAHYYAQKGDTEQVQEYIHTAEDLGFSLRDFQCIELYKAFVLGGHVDKAKEFWKPLSESGLLEKNSVDLSCNMIANGMVQEGKNLFLSEIQKRSYDLRMPLMTTMIDNGMSQKQVMQSAKEISTEDQLPIDDSILSYCYKDGRSDWAGKYLDLMKSQGMPMRPTYYLPILCNYSDQKDVEGLCKTTSKFLNVEHSNDNVDFIVDSLIAVVYPALTELGFTREDFVSKMPAADWNTIFFVMDLRKSLQTARDNIGDKKLNFSLLKCEQFFYLINGTLSKDWQEKLEVTKSMPPLLKEYVSERIILGMISRQDCKEFLVPALDYLKENEMTIRPFFSEMNSMKNHTKEVQEKVQAITKVSNQRYGSFKTPQELKTMTTEELDLLAGKSNDFRYKMVLLDRAFTDRDVKKVKVLVNDLVKLEFNWDRRYFKLVGFLMSSGCVEEAVTIFNGIADKMENLNPNIPMKLAAAQIESGNFEGCLETLKATCERTRDLNKEEMIYFNINTGRIFKCVTSLEQADAVMAAISLKNLVSDKHAPPITDRYVKNVLDIVTEDKLMEIVSDCVSKYKHFPVMTTVLTKLTKSLNVAQLKVAMTLGTKTMGTTEFHSRLATAFLNADMPTKAAAVMKSPAAKITKRDFHQQSLYFIKKNNIKALENLFEISKDFRVSQAQMLDYLVQGYVSADDTAKALTRLEASVQGHVIPLPSTVDLLTRTLTNKNQEIPQILRDAKNSYGKSSV